MFAEKLRKYKAAVMSRKDDPKSLTVFFGSIKAEIIKLLKKKRRSNSQKGVASTSSKPLQKRDRPDPKPLRKKLSGESTKASSIVDPTAPPPPPVNPLTKLNTQTNDLQNNFSTPVKKADFRGSGDFAAAGYKNYSGFCQFNFNEGPHQMLGKRRFKHDFERELELFIPSRFFVLTNNFFKLKRVKQ